jgi:putative FmdB family regulatory protein
MPIYEFACGACGERFEELVGPPAGKAEAELRCPSCGGERLQRLFAGSHAPPPRLQSPAQKRRLEAKRGIDRGGAKQRFKQRRTAERARRGSR